MRTRKRIVPGLNLKWTFVADPAPMPTSGKPNVLPQSPIPDVNLDSVYWTTYDLMLDETEGRKGRTARGADKRRPWYECSQFSCKSKSWLSQWPEAWSREGRVLHVDGNFTTIPISWICDALAPIPTDQIDRFSSQSVKLATEKIPSPVDLSVFLGELREGFGEVIPKLKDMLRLSSAFLSFKFGWGAFVQDLMKIIKSIKGPWKRLALLRKMQGIPFWHLNRMSSPPDLECVASKETNRLIHISRNLLTIPTDVRSTVSYGVRVETELTAYKLCSQICTLNRLRGLDSLWANFDALSVYYGLNNPFKTIWNLTRMSWLIGWFIDVESFLDKLEGDPFSEEGSFGSTTAGLTIRESHYSVKTFHTWKASAVITNLDGSEDVHELSSGIVKQYSRHHGLPPTSTSSGLELSLGQWEILAALIDQRLSDRKIF